MIIRQGKRSLPLPNTYTSSCSIVSHLLHMLYYQRCESMILKTGVKSKFVLWQLPYYNWLKKNDKKIHLFEVLVFWKRTVIVDLKKFSSNTIFRWYTFREFYIVKFSYFSERPNKVKERLWNIFDWPLCWWYWK